MPWAERGARSPSCTWSRRNYPLRVMQGYTIPTREAIAVLREHPPDQKDRGSARHRGDCSRPPRGAALRRPGAGAPAHASCQPSAVVLLRLWHPRRSALQLAAGARAAQGSAAELLRGVCASALALARARLELCDWTDAAVRDDGPNETPEERRLRHAACLCPTSAGAFIPTTAASRASTRSPMLACPASTHPGRIFLGLTVYFRHAGAQTRRHRWPAASRLMARIDRPHAEARPHRRRRAARRAHDLDRHAGRHRRDRLTYSGDKLVLTLPQQHAELDGERLRRRFESLAAVLGPRRRNPHGELKGRGPWPTIPIRSWACRARPPTTKSAAAIAQLVKELHPDVNPGQSRRRALQESHRRLRHHRRSGQTQSLRSRRNRRGRRPVAHGPPRRCRSGRPPAAHAGAPALAALIREDPFGDIFAGFRGAGGRRPALVAARMPATRSNSILLKPPSAPASA